MNISTNSIRIIRAIDQSGIEPNYDSSNSNDGQKTVQAMLAAFESLSIVRVIAR
jgi:hypothetical protein